MSRFDLMTQASVFVGRHSVYPDLTGKRRGEGGRRIKGDFAASKPDEPLVTILTVCWNSARTLEHTIRSIVNQTYRNIEHIVVDAASSDGTIDILRKYDSEIAYWVSEPDDGLYFAMNKCLELSRGDYILVLNSDDWYVPDCVQVLVEAKKTFSVDFVSALANYVNEEGRFVRLQPSFPYDAGVYFRMPLRHETMLVSRDLYNRFGPYDTRYFVNADRALTTAMYAAGVTHHEIPRPLMFFRDTGVSSTNMEKLYGERERMLVQHFPDLPTDDVASLARLHLLHPEQLVAIAKRYGSAKFARAASDYARDRKARRSGAFADFDFAELDALAAKAAQPAPASVPPKPLRVETFVTWDHGGAGLGTQRRVEALRSAGIDARIHCIFKNTDKPYVSRTPLAEPAAAGMDDKGVHTIWASQTVIRRDCAPLLNAQEMFSATGSVVDFSRMGDVVRDADIVHLHWVGGFFDYEAAPPLLSKKPVAWTLADMNAFTGGCHYSEGCDGYKRECRACPLLGGSDVAHEQWKTKKKAYAQIENLHVICPSQWLGERARESALLGDRPIHVIPNAFPVERFTPTNKLLARRQLNLPGDKKLVVFGAASLANRRKGGDLLCDAFAELKKTPGALDNVEGLFFGAHSLDLGVKAHSMGQVSDEERLSLIYAAADVFAFPSREDNAPLTVTESLLSGTPVVAFPVGNVAELVEHQVTGYIARYLDVADFAKGLAWALAEPRSPEALARSMKGYAHARRYNDPKTAASRHSRLYDLMRSADAGGSPQGRMRQVADPV